MIDMFSILIIFLILNFSSTGEIFFISKNVVLPSAANAHPIENKALISVLSNQIIFDAEKVGDNPEHLEESDMELPNLRRKLQQVRIFEQTVHPDKPFKGEVNIQADQNISLVYIKRVMNTLISEGWTGIHFIVSETENKNTATEGASE